MPIRGSGPAPGTWTITSRKSEGVTPGFTIRDSTGEIYWIKFDPKGFPEMASGAEVISTKFFHAFGYHVPENYLATLRPEELEIAPDATMKDEDGRRRRLTRKDIDDILENAAAQPDGTYRVLASRNLTGRVRSDRSATTARGPDDPNDISPHEHRRELRGLSVFAAWLNHDEVRSTNSLDTVVAGGQPADRPSSSARFRIDARQRQRQGAEPARGQRVRVGVAADGHHDADARASTCVRGSKWTTRDVPSVGRIESTYYRAEEWKPDYPNPAFKNARPEDRFWAARIVAAFTDDAVAGVVRAAEYSAIRRRRTYITKTLLERKTKVLAAWLNGTNPVVNVALSNSGELAFDERGRKGRRRQGRQSATRCSGRGSTTPPALITTPAPRRRCRGPAVEAPAALLSARPDYISARLRAFHADHPAWSHPLVVYFRRAGDGWSLVGLERNP